MTDTYWLTIAPNGLFIQKLSGWDDKLGAMGEDREAAFLKQFTKSSVHKTANVVSHVEGYR